MKFTDYVLARKLWFSAVSIDSLAHKVTRDLIRYRVTDDAEAYNGLLSIVRRYE